jgi:uncharacterized delta-60 repeat protein
MASQIVGAWRAPAAVVVLGSFAGAAWLGCDSLAGIQDGVLATSEGGPGTEGGLPEGAPGGETVEGGPGGESSTAPDFAMTLAAPIVGVVRGATGTVGITIARQNGFSGAVAVTVAALPSGITADALSIPAGATSGTLTLHAPTGATLGDGPQLTVTGTSGALVHTASLGLLVQDAPGTLDTTFGVQGVVSDSFRFRSFGAMALQPDGKIVVCGTVDEAPFVAFVRRFNADGSPDATFGASTDSSPPMVTVASPAAGMAAGCAALAVLSSGHIAFTGSAQDASQNQNAWVVELNPDGSTDAAFGTGGVAWAPTSLQAAGATSIAEGAGGSLLIVGAASTGSISGGSPYIARFSSNGVIDTTFGGNGLGYTVSGYAKATGFNALAPATGGQFLAALDLPTFGVQRYAAAGLLDSTFFNQGTATLSLGVGASTAKAVTVQSDGSVVAVGSAVASANDGSSTSEIAVARFASTGHPDPQFGTGGGAALALGSGNSWGNGVAIDPSGRAVVAGHVESSGFDAFGVVRLTTSGTLDATFAGGQGFVSTQAGNGGSEAISVATRSDGRILAAGATGTWGVSVFCPKAPDGGPRPCNWQTLLLARYWP